MKKLAFLILILVASSFCSIAGDHIGLTLIPSGVVSDKTVLDIRAGIVNGDTTRSRSLNVELILSRGKTRLTLLRSLETVPAGGSRLIRHSLPTAGLVGENNLILRVKEGKEILCEEKTFTVVSREAESTGLIEGAWVGFYHWSEVEGKNWNSDIRKMTADNWKGLVRQMHSVGMDMIVMQESFRNQEYVGQHDMTVESYAGKAFYPSGIYPYRMDVACGDPIEAMLSEADVLGMDVMVGVGMFAWFDFSPESLLWHIRVAGELWERYGHHASFYGFYISEECAGNLFNSETTAAGQHLRKQEICSFFREMKRYLNNIAPEKPLMLATNSMDILAGADAYPALLQNLDILCPFGFARMPEGDLTGMEAASTLKDWCGKYGAHLWFDLEAFLFNPDMSLYPRPIGEIIHDLNLLNCFEKVLCYQFPGVFNAPWTELRIGEERTVGLYNDYLEYYNKTK